jgi:DNA repair protein RecO (recombination protein O)
MSVEKAEALVIRVIDFSETSAVVTLFTREFGKVAALAKGARRLKGPFESALDLLARVRIVFLRKSSEALDLLTEAQLERRFRSPGRDLSRLYGAYYVAELLNDLTDDDDPHPDLFDAACEALDALGGESTPPGDAILRWELVALRILGHLPSLDACVECGKAVAAGRRTSFGLAVGGVLCDACRPGKKHVASLSAPAVERLRQFAEPGEGWKNAEIDRRQAGELRGIVNQYVSHLLGHPPRMQDYLSLPGSRS